jgi:hypothetical protein
MFRPRLAAAGILAVTLGLIAVGLNLRPTAAAGPLPPAPTPPPIDCLVNCVLPGPTPVQFQPNPSPTPRPTVEPSPGPTQPPAPVPGIGELPHDFGIKALIQWVYGGVHWGLPQLPSIVAQPAQPADWFWPLYQRMETIAAFLMLFFLIIGATAATVRRDLVLLFRVPFIDLPVVCLLTGGAVVLVQQLMLITDNLTLYMLQATGGGLDSLMKNTAAVFAPTEGGLLLLGPESVIAFGLAIIMLLAFIGILLELLARLALIYILVAFVPLTLAARLWPRLAHIAVTLGEILVGTIIVKFVVVAILVIGAAMLNASVNKIGPQGEFGIVTALAGAMVLVAGLLSPLGLAKIIPAGTHAISHLSSQWRGYAGTVVRSPLFGGRVPTRIGSPDRATLRIAGNGGGGAVAFPAGTTVIVRPPRPASATPGQPQIAGRTPRPAPAPNPRPPSKAGGSLPAPPPPRGKRP